MRPIQRTAYVDNAYNLVLLQSVLEDTFSDIIMQDLTFYPIYFDSDY